MSAAEHIGQWQLALDRVGARVEQLSSFRGSGRIVRATGMVLEAVGLRLPLGSACRIELNEPGQTETAEAEVVGFSGERVYLMPLGQLHGLVPGARVFPLGEGRASARRFPVGEALLGRVVDGNGRPLDGLGELDESQHSPLTSPPVNPLRRAPIAAPIDVGIRAINALLSVGRGQRMGLFAGSGVGKSVLLGMMARFTRADVIVVGLIGERGREVQDFIDNILGEEGRRRAVVVAAPADTSPLQRLQGAAYATRLAEHFRDAGRNVLLIMDSLTRYAMAQREIALAIGEPPATKGYPPSVFAKLPALVERAGNGEHGSGSITAFYTVLTEGDDQQDPIADSARAILDGHVVLSRSLAESGHYPAIDIEASISRAMNAVVDDRQQQMAQRFKQLFARYQRNRDLISVGAYSPGHDALLDQAVQAYPRLEAFLQQGMNDVSDLEGARRQLAELFGGNA
ncbi:flagellar protein export ATPase FliI [Halomonas marinisediminis]|uniref:Flagellum-specific ATP synthase n=1 Tax=Halomonas marinisediminis TaxID=2546095 RepID=A0ABY2D8A1_9GAMM|nr:flagellar protein export ATPase FliI [Halomonas marinisediminis]TDB01936.1 flagellar protein export ATPase FliI [Halomonas marinisediminis]